MTWEEDYKKKSDKQLKECENVLECNIYIEGVAYPIVSRVFLHRKSSGFSRAPISAVRGEQIDVVKEIEYQLNRIGYKKDLTKT